MEPARDDDAAAQRTVKAHGKKESGGIHVFQCRLKEIDISADCGADTGCVGGDGGYHDGIKRREAATSGVSLVDMVNTLFINIFAAVATGGAVVSSQYLGQRRRDRACQSANQLILITACISLIIMVLCILYRRGCCICSTAAWPGM